MFPGINGFHWTFAHIVFLALFFAVVLAILTTVLAAVMRSVRDFRTRRAAAICWKLEFAELPEAERRCRHDLAGRVLHRVCPNAFDCRACPDYEHFAGLPATAPGMLGLSYPEDRFYHRGHTWVRPENDGTYTIGLDDLAEHLVGEPGSVELPAPGTELELNRPAWRIRKGDAEIPVRAPIDGVVVETGGAAQGWYLRVRPDSPANLRHLLHGADVAPWLAKELERLQLQLGAPDAAPALADGGVLMSGLMDAMPQADWDSALAGTFLNP